MDRRGNLAEVRKGGVAAANARHAVEDVAEFIGCGDLLHFGAGIGDGDEAVAGFLRADLLLDLLEKVLLVDEEEGRRSEEHTSELQSHLNLVCRLLLEKKKKNVE